MLELRPICENCATDLPGDCTNARICSYECTFCFECAENVLSHVCPNCTGVLLPRPPRPTDQLAMAPPTDTRTIAPVDTAAHPAKIAARNAVTPDQLHLWEVVIDCADPQRLGEFYAQLSDVELHVFDPSWTYLTLPTRGAQLRAGVSPTADGIRVAFQAVPETKSGKVRVHLDFGARSIDRVVTKAIELGATQLTDYRTDQSGTFVVMADPEGHEFCIVDA